MPLPLIPKPGKLEIALAVVKPGEARAADGQRQSTPRTASSIASLHDVPASWERWGINE